MKFLPLAALVFVNTLSSFAQQAAPSAVPGQSPAPAPRLKLLPIDFNDHDGWKQIFDGTSLNGWQGESTVWSVKDGAIVGQFNVPEGTRNGQTFLLLKDLKPADFELKLQIKVEGVAADSGIQYRSYVTPPAVPRPGSPPLPSSAKHDPRFELGGYQFDFNFVSDPPGGLAEGGPHARGVIAYRGQFVHTEAGKTPRLIAEMGTREGLGEYFKENDWNDIHIIVRGNQITHIINGHIMAALIDDDPAHFRADGVIGLQASGNGPQKISFKNIWLKEYVAH
jgi:hypothetical protein